MVGNDKGGNDMGGKPCVNLKRSCSKTRVGDCVFFIVMAWPGAANPGRFRQRDRELVGRHFSVMTISNPVAPAASLSQ
jgi:hypothetical protein